MDKMVACAKHAGPTVKLSQLCGNFSVAGHVAESASVCVHAVKVMEVQWPDSSHSAYILDGWFAGATSLNDAYKNKCEEMQFTMSRV